MVKNWTPVVVPNELIEVLNKYFKENERELKLRHGVRSRTGLVAYALREWLKSKDII